MGWTDRKGGEGKEREKDKDGCVGIDLFLLLSHLSNSLEAEDTFIMKGENTCSRDRAHRRTRSHVCPLCSPRSGLPVPTKCAQAQRYTELLWDFLSSETLTHPITFYALDFPKK